MVKWGEYKLRLVVKRRLLTEGQELKMGAAIRDLKPIAAFRVQRNRDGMPVVDLEVWYFEIEP